MMNVTKGTAEVYQVRGETSEGWGTWGDIVLMLGEHEVQVIANTDYGLYTYYWGGCGCDPKQFLCGIDIHYAMKKLAGDRVSEPDTDEYPNEIKRQIIDARLEDNLSKQEAREAWDDMLGILTDYPGGDIMFHHLIEHELFEKVFGDYDGLPRARRMAPECVCFWNNIWLPFVEQLKAELKQAA